jgi:hypothetical protein
MNFNIHLMENLWTNCRVIPRGFLLFREEARVVFRLPAGVPEDFSGYSTSRLNPEILEWGKCFLLNAHLYLLSRRKALYTFVRLNGLYNRIERNLKNSTGVKSC